MLTVTFEQQGQHKIENTQTEMKRAETLVCEWPFCWHTPLFEKGSIPNMSSECQCPVVVLVLQKENILICRMYN